MKKSPLLAYLIISKKVSTTQVQCPQSDYMTIPEKVFGIRVTHCSRIFYIISSSISPEYILINKNVNNDKSKNKIQDKKSGNFILRQQILKDFPPKELRSVIDQAKKDIKQGIIVSISTYVHS